MSVNRGSRSGAGTAKGGGELMESIVYGPIGIVHSLFTKPSDMSIQPVGLRTKRSNWLRREPMSASKAEELRCLTCGSERP